MAAGGVVGSGGCRGATGSVGRQEEQWEVVAAGGAAGSGGYGGVVGSGGVGSGRKQRGCCGKWLQQSKWQQLGSGGSRDGQTCEQESREVAGVSERVVVVSKNAEPVLVPRGQR